MITKEELQQLLMSTETFRVERTVSTNNMDKFCEAICAFSNDIPDSRQNGYLILGANDDGSLSGLKVDDALLKKIAAIRSDGNILPLPVMNVDRFEFPGGDLLVAEVQPSFFPPVRYRGRTFIRIGPRKDIASEAEERILTERRTANMATFDITPCIQASIEDILVDKIKQDYLPKAIDAEILASDTRDIKEQMASLCLYDIEHDCPTYAAIVLFGKTPKRFLPGDYIQFVKFKGLYKAAEIEDERAFNKCFAELLPQLDVFIEYSIVKKRPVPVSVLREKMVSNYPYWAIRELMMNALMHRDFQTNMPVRLYQYNDRIEIMNPGGLYGKARPENFPTVNDYRNPIISEAMKVMGYVNKFNRGIDRVQRMLLDNGSPQAQFDVNKLTVFEVVVNECKAANSETTEQVTIPVTVPVTVPLTMPVEELLGVFQGEMSRTELMNILNLKNKAHFKTEYIRKALELGVIEMTQPDSPNSPTQKYRLTEKGKLLVK